MCDLMSRHLVAMNICDKLTAFPFFRYLVQQHSSVSLHFLILPHWRYEPFSMPFDAGHFAATSA